MDTKEGAGKTVALDWVANYTIDPELKRLALLEKARMAAAERQGDPSPWRRRVMFIIEWGPIRRGDG